MKLRRRALGLLVAGTGLVVAGFAIWRLISEAAASDLDQPTDFAAIPARVDFAAPALTLEDLAGERHSLTDYHGEVVLVNLWATWCPPCEAEMPVFEAYFKKHAPKGFLVIAINDGEPRRDVQLFVAEHGLTFPVWLDPTYIASERAFKTPNLPTSYVIDRGGRVRLMWVGAINQRNLEDFVSPLIEE